MRKLNLILFILLVSVNLFAKHSFYTEDKVLIDGYDPVSYLKSNKAKEGSAKYSIDYEGIKIHFSSIENKELFIKSPKKYLPQYNGWCAYAMSETSELVEVNPKTFKVVDGKVYLFYKNFFVNTLKKWNTKKDAKQITQAQKNWLKLK